MTTEQTAEKPKSMQLVLKSQLEKMKPEIAQIIPAGTITADRQIKVVLACTMKNPDLLKCDLTSILLAVQQASELGLELGGGIGEAHLVPFRQNGVMLAQMIIGFQGMLKLVRQSGELRSLTNEVVYRGEPFKVDLGNGTVTHERDYGSDVERTMAEVIAAYVILRFKDGGQQVTVVPRAELEAIRKSSKAQGVFSPWNTHRVEMYKKTAIRRAFKLAPKSSTKSARVAEILAETEETEFAHDEPTSAPTALLERVQAKAQATARRDATDTEIVEHDPVTGEVVPSNVGREPGDDSEEAAS